MPKSKDEPLVLVVDDFADAREMYGEYLKFCGFRVAEAQNGVEAIEKAKKLKPDLILMDLVDADHRRMGSHSAAESRRRDEEHSRGGAHRARHDRAFGKREERGLRRGHHQAVPAARSDQADSQGDWRAAERKTT